MKSFHIKSKSLYKNLRFQTKLTLIHLLTASIPLIVLGLFFHVKLYDMIVADTIRMEQPATAHTAALIEDSISHTLDVHNQITNTNFFQSLNLPQTSKSLSTLTTSEDAISFQDTLNQLANKNIVKNIKIYMDISTTNPIFHDTPINSTILSIDNTRGTYWNGIFNGDPKLEALFCPSFYLDSYEIQHYGDSAYITKFILNYAGKKVPCFLTLYLDTSYFEALLKDNLTSSSNVAYLINNRDNLIATSDLALYGTYHFSYTQVQSYFMSSNNFIQKQVLNEPVYASFYNIKNTDWYLVVAMPSQPIIDKAIYIMLELILIYIICMLITFCITSLLSHSITDRLSLVISQMSKARIAPPVALPPPDTQDEIGDLVSTYNYMTRVIEQLMENQVKVAEDLRIAEFNSLQSQINPHFLYNTMDMINWLSQQGRVQEVTNSIQKLSRFYKLTLNHKESLSTIEAEIEHISIYVELQNMRFCNAIDFIIDIPDNLLEYTIPKLTFQPVIENSILHGILEKSPREGTIVLTGWMEDNAIVILISDDGVGILPEKLQNILKSCDQPSQYGHSNIAVYNTHRRLQLMYGPSYGLTYSSIYGQGTEVEIRLPRS